MCNHTWTYRNGRSECVRCNVAAADVRGLPHGHYAINGTAMTTGRIALSFACPTCLADINPRMVDGELRILCVGPKAHDIAAMGRAITKEHRDYLRQKQEDDFYAVLNGLPEELRKEIGGDASVSHLVDEKMRERERDQALPIEPKTRGRHKLFKT